MGSILLAYIVLYLPITKQLDNALITKWQASAEAKAFALVQAIQKGLEGGDSLSSRSAIRDKILEYTQGAVSWEELQDYTNQKYADGAAVLENIVFAYRRVDQNILVEYIAPGQESILEAARKLPLDETRNRILQLNGDTYLIVISPISVEGELLGTDIICYDLSSTLAELNTDMDQVRILNENDMQEQGPHETQTEQCLIGAKNVLYVEKLSDVNASVSIQTTLNAILGQTKRNTYLILLVYVILVLLLFLLSNRLFVTQTREVINKIEDSKQGFMNMAYKDALTGAYSRQYLESWIQQNTAASSAQNESFTIVLIDVDKLKMINDRFGHETGDYVLKSVVDTCHNVLRKQDLIIRFGGDEFLIILKGMNEKDGKNVMDRIVMGLDKLTIQSMKIGISYGISTVKNIAALSAGIKDADSRMYTSKWNKFPD